MSLTFSKTSLTFSNTLVAKHVCVVLGRESRHFTVLIEAIQSIQNLVLSIHNITVYCRQNEARHNKDSAPSLIEIFSSGRWWSCCFVGIRFFLIGVNLACSSSSHPDLAAGS